MKFFKLLSNLFSTLIGILNTIFSVITLLLLKNLFSETVVLLCYCLSKALSDHTMPVPAYATTLNYIRIL
jgi:hypothetical protein